MPTRKAQRQQAPKKKQEEELSLELAVDPRSFVQPVVQEPPPPSGLRAPAPLAARGQGAGELQVGDLFFDAHLLSDYGDPPRHWLLSPLYAWRVVKRQREIKQALVGRREEAARAAAELEDALVAFAERAKPAAEHNEAYADALADARRAEETLRSRDAVLAADQDAHNARLASVEARLAKLEAELVSSQNSERALAAEIASSQGTLGRAESKLKRAESELRAAAREGIGTGS